MVGYIIRRVLWIIPVLLVVSFLTFSLMKATPGGPWDREKELSDRQKALLNAKYGLDDPFMVQYVRWLVGWPGGWLPARHHPGRPGPLVPLPRPDRQ